ncbi:hypothetical protein [Sulfurisphaera ohwakuensis]|uniref:hypothetical protein n=1 Tax=Sulfurisphaera ohwakuensis TaxID=69656 RepID=UPI0036F3FB58
MKWIILLFSILFSIPLLIPVSFSIPVNSQTFVIVNGKIYLGTSEGIYSLSNNSFLLKGYNVSCLAYLNGFYFISNNTLYYYNGSTITLINVPHPQRIFIDNYTDNIYVVSDYQYVYVIHRTTIVKSYYIYESFGFLTFTSSYAIVDSQAGFTYLYYNGTNRTVIYYQDALTGMIYGNSTFIVGSFSPNGLWIFTNLSVLDLPVIPVNYFSQLRYYNIVYVPLPFTPYWVYYGNGLIYAIGYYGYAVIYPKNNYQLVYLNYTRIFDSGFYNDTLYLLTPYGVAKVRYTPPPIYTLTIKEVGLPSNSPFIVVLNNEKYISYNSTITFHLAGSTVYNLTFLNYMSFRPNVTTLTLNLTENLTLFIKYSTDNVSVKIFIEGINNQTPWTLYIDGKEYKEIGSSAILSLYNSTSYMVNVSVPGFRVSPTNLIFITTGDNTIVFTATPIITSTTQIATSTLTLGTSTPLQNYFNYLIIAVAIVIIVFILFLIWGVRRR